MTPFGSAGSGFLVSVDLEFSNVRDKSWQHCVQTQAKVINIIYHCLPWIMHASFLLSHCQTSYMVSRGKKTKRHFIITGP